MRRAGFSMALDRSINRRPKGAAEETRALERQMGIVELRRRAAREHGATICVAHRAENRNKTRTWLVGEQCMKFVVEDASLRVQSSPGVEKGCIFRGKVALDVKRFLCVVFVCWFLFFFF